MHAAVKIQRGRSGYGRSDWCVRVCVLWFISTLQQSFGNYAQGFTHGGSGSGGTEGRGAAGISWALHFEAVEGSLGRKAQTAEADHPSRQALPMAARVVCTRQLISIPLLTPRR